MPPLAEVGGEGLLVLWIEFLPLKESRGRNEAPAFF